MRRSLKAAIAVVTTALFAVAPATASADPDGGGPVPGGWVRAPQGSFDRAAGVVCDFPIHSQPVVDEVQKLTLDTNADGSPKRELYAGDLILEITRTDTGAVTHADASGTAFIDYNADGSQTWSAVGPVMMGVREGASNLPRGLWLLDGVYTIEFSPGFTQRTVTFVHGTTHNICTDLA